MDIKQLRTFCLVANKGGFSIAAKQLGISQPTVSFQINALEEQLGTQLLDRSGRETLLTEAGQIFYKYARRIVDLSQEAEQAIDQIEGLIRGKLILGASTIPGEYILPRLLQKFRERFPGIEVTLCIGDTGTVIDQVLEDDVDLGAVGAIRKSDKLVFTKFVTDRLTLIVPAQNPWIGQDTIKLEEITKAPFVMRERGSGTRATINQKLKDLGITDQDLNVVMTVGSTTAVVNAVESGAGVSFVSERAAAKEVQLGLLRKVQVAGLETERDFYMVSRKHKLPSPATSALLQVIEAEKANL